MNKPDSLVRLLKELDEADLGTTVGTVKGSQAFVGLPGEPDAMAITAEECEALLDTPETAEQFFKTLGQPEGASLELHSVVVEDDVLEKLAELFDTVDQG